MFKNKTILCISAHMDDIEFGCAGLIKTLENDSVIYVLALSKDRKDSKGSIQEVRDLDEQYKSLEFLNVPKSNLFISENIPGQLFPEYRQEILEEMYRVKSLINPDIVITTSENDIHQDHRTVNKCAQKAFSRTTRLSYEIVNATDGFLPNIFFEITEEALKAKVMAIDSYKTQQDSSITSGDYFSEEIIKSLAVSRGARVGVKYAEAFECENILIGL
ncbi:PIG-L deacetylase family protein [Sulfurimonas sp.]|uniref:PIG-L deacetylase family protein n=1 Tax=Sulfurimonas sp. TaxID=2022749 RepID=UPI003562F0F5